MTRYDAKIDVPPAFPPQSLAKILGEVLSERGVSQLRTAETEKYAHVTYFFNGGVEQAFPGEERRLVPSNRDVATYDLAPEMSAAPVTDGVVEALKPGGPDFILVNYANPDMVGHTGMLKPAVSALETIDACIGRIVTAAAAAKATVFITADHGNCETMIDPEDGPAAHRAHDEPDSVHRHRRRSDRTEAARGRTAGGRGTDRARPDGHRAAAGHGRAEPVFMSIGKRLIDLARAELNSLLDRAARTDDEDDRSRRRWNSGAGARRRLRGDVRRGAGGGDRTPRARRRDEVEEAVHGRRRTAPPPRTPPRTASGDDAIRKAYAALEVPAGSDFETVKKSYRRLMRKYHPDLHGGAPEKYRAATDLTQRLTQAYKTLEKHLRR